MSTSLTATDALRCARESILAPAGLDEGRIEQALGLVLGSAGDAADLYFQLARAESWGLEDGIVKEGSASIEQGVGVRAMAGEKTGFAYSDEIMMPALEEAARAARAIAVQSGSGAVQAWHPVSAHRLYLPIDPLLGLSVCYDVRFPELYRPMAAAGAQWFTVPSAFTLPTGRAHWETLLRARAIENLSYVVAPAQWGRHASGRETYGDSLIIDYWGAILSRLPSGEGVIVGRLDLAAQEVARRDFPALSHRVM